MKIGCKVSISVNKAILVPFSVINSSLQVNGPHWIGSPSRCLCMATAKSNHSVSDYWEGADVTEVPKVGT